MDFSYFPRVCVILGFLSHVHPLYPFSFAAQVFPTPVFSFRYCLAFHSSPFLLPFPPPWPFSSSYLKGKIAYFVLGLLVCLLLLFVSALSRFSQLFPRLFCSFSLCLFQFVPLHVCCPTIQYSTLQNRVCTLTLAHSKGHVYNKLYSDNRSIYSLHVPLFRCTTQD